MISSLSSVYSGGYLGLVSRNSILGLIQSRPDRVARSERIDLPDIEEYDRVRFSEASPGKILPRAVGSRTPAERYLEIAAL